MNILLTGLRGSGKTSLGKIIAQKMKKKFIDLDQYIETEAQDSIKNIVATKGWEEFRRLETIASKALAQEDNLIIATGGGTITFPQNAKALKENGFVIYLQIMPLTSVSRIINDPNRPPLTLAKDLESEVTTLYQERTPIYRQTADLIFERSDNLESDAEKIINQIANEN